MGDINNSESMLLFCLTKPPPSKVQGAWCMVHGAWYMVHGVTLSVLEENELDLKLFGNLTSYGPN